MLSNGKQRTLEHVERRKGSKAAGRTGRLRAVLLYFNTYLSGRVEVIRGSKLKDTQACEQGGVTRSVADEPVGTKCLSRRFAAFAKPLAHTQECADALPYAGRYPVSEFKGQLRAATGGGESATQTEGL